MATNGMGKSPGKRSPLDGGHWVVGLDSSLGVLLFDLLQGREERLSLGHMSLIHRMPKHVQLLLHRRVLGRTALGVVALMLNFQR